MTAPAATFAPQPAPAASAPAPTPEPRRERRPRPPQTAVPSAPAPAPAPAPTTQAQPAPAAPQPTYGQIPSWNSAPAPAPTPPPAPGPSTVPAPGTPTAPYAAGAQYQAATALQDAGQSPDRAALASDALKNLIAESEPAFQAAQRSIGQNAAKFGRIGSGVTTTELGDLGAARDRSIVNASAQLANSAAGQTLDDRLALAREALQQYGAFQGADQSAKALDLQKTLGLGNLDLSRTLGLGNLDLSRQQLAQSGQQFADSLALQRLGQDRNFFLDDRTAEAMAALGGANFTTGGLSPTYTPPAAQTAVGGYTVGPDGTLIPAGSSPAPTAPGATLLPPSSFPVLKAPELTQDPTALALATLKGVA